MRIASDNPAGKQRAVQLGNVRVVAVGLLESPA
jgi:hypothetical protein